VGIALYKSFWLLWLKPTIKMYFSEIEKLFILSNSFIGSFFKTVSIICIKNNHLNKKDF